MNTFSNAFRAEVQRMARKELKADVQGMREALSKQRTEIAELKKSLKGLTSELKATQKQTTAGAKKPRGVSAEYIAGSATVPTPAATPSHDLPFGPGAFLQKRKELGITQKEMGALLGASAVSVWKWETGAVQPRDAQLVRIAQLLKLGKRQALSRIAKG